MPKHFNADSSLGYFNMIVDTAIQVLCLAKTCKRQREIEAFKLLFLIVGLYVLIYFLFW